MSNKVIYPEGMDLVNHINNGDAICNKCGALMNRKADPKGGCDIYVCPGCGWEIDEMEYEYEDDDEDDYDDEDVVPPGCSACGGPYPDCKTSCKLFDD